MSRNKSSANRRAANRLVLQQALPSPPARTIPRRWLNTIIGLFLLPVAWVLTETFFNLFTRVGQSRDFWTSDEFWFFALGAILWTLWFFGSIWKLGEPRPLRGYVFGHELTHAIWVWLWGGRVSRFKVSREGGYILTDTHNFWIALAPYFYPIYSFAVILAYGIASLFWQVVDVDDKFMLMTPLQWLFLLLGVTWAFHLSFTIWMIPKGQTDLTYHGTFFSLVIIYIMNLLLLTVFVVIVARGLTFPAFAHELLRNTEDFSESAWNGAQRIWANFGS